MGKEVFLRNTFTVTLSPKYHVLVVSGYSGSKCELMPGALSQIKSKLVE
jgi:hypothetical protein